MPFVFSSALRSRVAVVTAVLTLFVCSSFGSHRGRSHSHQRGAEAATETPELIPDEVLLANPHAPLQIRRVQEGRMSMALVEGGIAGTQRSERRCAVGAFVSRCGAQAGLNGAFFANASLHGHDSQMIGPTLCTGEPNPLPGVCDGNTALTRRPLVLLSPTQSCIVPYQTVGMDDEAGLHRILPDVTDAFLGGVWLVHNGVAATPAQLALFQVHDAEDFRRRAFFVIEPDGRPGIGATTAVASSQKLATALQAAGVREAVLLDSGFSTSLVYGRKIVVTGHTSPGLPSRPVPHAIVLYAVRPAASSPPRISNRTAA